VPDPDALLDGLAADVAPDGVSVGAVFGKRALKAYGKAFACLKGDELAFRLGDGSAEHAEALALDGAALFDPSARDKPFKDWVAVPVAHAGTWSGFARAALARLGL
jgi:hypothetical protein